MFEPQNLRLQQPALRQAGMLRRDNDGGLNWEVAMKQINPAQPDVPEFGGDKNSTVVCVTNQFGCERLIKAGRILADLSGTVLYVIHVVNPAVKYELSKLNNAAMSILYNEDVFRAISTFIKENKTVNVVTGFPGDEIQHNENNVLDRLWNRFCNTKFFVVDYDGELKDVKHPAART